MLPTQSLKVLSELPHTYANPIPAQTGSIRAALIIIICLLTLETHAQQASFNITSCDTFHYFKSKNYGNYANPTGEKQLLSLYSWNKEQSSLFDPATNHTRKGVSGLQTKTRDVTFIYDPDADIIRIIGKKVSGSVEAWFKYEGIPYYFLYDALKRPQENIKIRSYMQDGKSFLVIPVSPDVDLLHRIFSNERKYYSKITRKAYKLLVIDESGKVVRGIGRYDKAYSERILTYADVFSFDCDTLKKRVFLTDKISGTVRVYDLLNGNEISTIKLSDSENQQQQYPSRRNNATPEQPFQFLIEAKSTGDIFYDAKHELLFVLKTDSIPDPTKGESLNAKKRKPITYLKNSKDEYYRDYSDRFYKLMRAYYFNKPVFIQCYDKAFNFLGQAQINVPNESQIVIAEDGSLLVHTTVAKNNRYVLYKLNYTIR